VILLDTHVILWLALEPEKISRRATVFLQEARDSGVAMAISPVSLYEIARLAGRGRVNLRFPTDAFLRRVEVNFRVQPITVPVAIAAGQFADPFPGDPADRIIAATALIEGMPLVTADERIRRSKVVKTIW
jgi:PIN domain nuclease of toxin-antitoxin system